jgi:hypothetical protein
LHEISDKQVEPEVINHHATENLNDIVIGKKLSKDWIYKQAQHGEVCNEQEAEKSDEDVGDHIPLPD